MSDDTDPPRAGVVLTGVPHAAALKLTLIDLQPGAIVCKVPYAPELVGDPGTGVVHGGVITALLDNACGIAVSSKSGQFGAIATLDLRLDYMRPATPGEDILAFAECVRLTRHIAFARAIAYHGDRGDPIATCSAAFMLGTKGTAGANLPASGPAAEGKA